MTRHDPAVTFREMLDHASEAVSLASNRNRADLDEDRLLNLSLTRLLEVAGEAANRIPSEERARYPEIPWNQLIGLRNRLIHGYDAIDFDILWQIVTADLPPLVEALRRIITGFEKSR